MESENLPLAAQQWILKLVGKSVRSNRIFIYIVSKCVLTRYLFLQRVTE